MVEKERVQREQQVKGTVRRKEVRVDEDIADPELLRRARWDRLRVLSRRGLGSTEPRRRSRINGHDDRHANTRT